MANWKNLDTLKAFEELKNIEKVRLQDVLSGEDGAKRVGKYCVPMAEGLAYNFAAKAVDDEVLSALAELAREAQLAEKYCALYSGEMINTLPGSIEQYCPIINDINPATVMNLAFYRMSIFNDSFDFYLNMAKIIGMGVLFLVIGTIILRREKYATL